MNRKTLGASHPFVLQGSYVFSCGCVNEFCKILRGSHKVPFQPLRSKALACVLSHLAEVRELKYGKTKKYFVAYNALLTSDVVKYKHTIHYHKVTFLKNNQTIVVPCTYDAHKTPNVISIDEHGDYIIFKEYIPEDLLSVYKKVENAKYPDIYSVPHTDITIKTTSKEVME